MAKPSSKRIQYRFHTGLFGLLLILVAGSAVHSYKKQFELDTDGVFIPLNLIAQTNIAYAALRQDLNTLPAIAQDYPCSARQKAVLIGQITGYDGLENSPEQAEKRLKYVYSEVARSSSKASCKNFPEVLQGAYKLRVKAAENPAISVATLSRQLFSQNLTWDGTAFCIYAQDKQGEFLVSGRSVLCEKSHTDFSASDAGRQELKKSFTPLLVLAKNRKNALPSDADKNLTLTIDPSLQLLLRQITQCAPDDAACKEAFSHIFKNVAYATFSLVDADTREILAIGCYGKACSKEPHRSLGLLAGANIEAPPASTAKLLFSYALANANVINTEQLALQIKTSGQLDNQVSKRNEWWEKQAVCDKSLVNERCPIPQQTLMFAKTLGWNNACSASANRLCGNSGILAPLGLREFSPASGRLLVSANSKGIFLREDFFNRPYMQWDDYDAIRQGKKNQASRRHLENTSLVVQSVIGAGNNRVTSLGLAMLSSGLYQASTTGTMREVSLFRNASAIRQQATRQSALSVINGMQKVVRPAEKGWLGDGTANGAFLFAFGKTCDTDCPVYAKTGTVSHQDKVFGGMTLFTALIKTKELKAATGISGNTEQRNIALGVISHPAGIVKEHQASRLGMLLAREIIEHDH
jgi:hypothetical protein